MECVLVLLSFENDIILEPASLLLVNDFLDSHLVEPVPLVISSGHFWGTVGSFPLGGTLTSNLFNDSRLVDAFL